MKVRLRRRKKSANLGNECHILSGFGCLILLMFWTPHHDPEISLELPEGRMIWPRPLSVTSPSIYFVHVGKAGGMTLRVHLPVPLAKNKKELVCWQRNESDAANCLAPSSNSSSLTNHIRGHIHIGSSFFSPDERDFLMSHTDTFLFSIRNPIDRVISAFYYHQNQKIRYPLYQCFLTMNELVYSLGKGNQSDCSQLARRVLNGNTTAGGAHFAYNYEYYEDETVKKKPNRYVAVIRAEHLWQDAKDLDKMVGGTGVLQGDGQRFTHYSASEQQVTTRNIEIPKVGLASLCYVLAREIESYMTLLSRAINLKPSTKLDSLRKVQEQCGVAVPGTRSSIQQLIEWYSC